MGAAPRWGVVSTSQAPAEQVLAFVAHHLGLGAHRIWLHFDNPDDPAADMLSRQDRGTVIRCDAAYWTALYGRRPETHQERQVKNATRVARKAGTDWVAHIDIDEFLTGAARVADVLAGVATDRLVLRVEPWEALHDPALAPDIFTARAFRRQIPAETPELASRLYGRYGAVLDRGMLSHSVGKCFFRTGVRDMAVRIHGARIKGETVFGGRFHPDLALLHFHAQDPAAWKGRLAFRLARGAYRSRPALPAMLEHASAAEIDGFFDAVQCARPEMIRALQAHGLLRFEDLGLRRKVDVRFPGMPTSSGSADPA